MTPPDSLAADAILRTLLYADVFGFPLTETEIHHFLIGVSATPEEVQATLRNSPCLAESVECINGYYVLRGRAELVRQREARTDASLRLWSVARRYGTWMAHLPFVRMVALTGALAMRNANDRDDDIDYLLVTKPGRVWTARAYSIVLVRLVRLWGVKLCPNYVLAESALVQDKQNVFMAHELAQMVPLAGHSLYHAMRTVNLWAFDLLPNADSPFYTEPDTAPRGLGRAIQRLAEIIFSGSFGDAFERWEQSRKLRKFAPQAQQPGSAAQLDEQRIKGHFNDYGGPALAAYQERLERYNLSLHGYDAELAGSHDDRTLHN